MKNNEYHRAETNPILLMPEKVWKEYVALKASMFDYVENLPEDEKLVLALHYYEGLAFSEIGILMDIQEWDAIVLHTQALMKLQPTIGKQVC